jgi:hypothetical protein
MERLLGDGRRPGRRIAPEKGLLAGMRGVEVFRIRSGLRHQPAMYKILCFNRHLFQIKYLYLHHSSSYFEEKFFHLMRCNCKNKKINYENKKIFNDIADNTGNGRM